MMKRKMVRMKPNNKINFCGAVQDASGYGEFSRYFISSLVKSGVEVSVENIAIDPKDVGFGDKGAVCKQLLGKRIGAYTNIVNMVPPLFKKFKKNECMNIGFTMWEASKLPSLWVDICNDMDAIFVPCNYNKKIFMESGVDKPVYVIQPGIDIEEYTERKRSNKEFTFYSIFQWTERKNPESLLKAYFSAFAGIDDVNLVIKTYVPRIPNQRHFVNEQIERVKSSLKMPNGKYPKITVIADRISSDEVNKLHYNCDCFVLPHASEGWGMPHMEAMWYGNPVISTGYSGNMDFMNDENSYLVKYGMKPVSNMHHFGVPWFDATMWWAEPHIDDIADKMLFVYKNRDCAYDTGKRARDYIIQNFNFVSSSTQLLNAVEDLISKRD